ncbi:hypothetical protein Sjap_016350 [Stephania japonica]|uniref:Ufm1-specific protease n=1 Tax=Stephania japonica TaxID=461633 RepID=A0AAP0IKX1_9MAGN
METKIRVLCRKRKLVLTKEPGLQWLIGSPFFPQFTIVSTIRSLHLQSSLDPCSPDYSKESYDLRTLIVRGFEVIGAVLVSDHGFEANARKAAEAARRIRRFFTANCGDGGGDDGVVVGAAADLVTGETRFFVSNSAKFDRITDVCYEELPEKFVWDRGCLIRCELGIKLPIFVPANNQSVAEEIFFAAIDGIAALLKDQKIVYVVEGHKASEGALNSVIVRGVELDATLKIDNSKESANSLPCSSFCAENKSILHSGESADAIKVSVLLNQSSKSSGLSAPVAEYFPAQETAKLVVISFNLEVLCYAARDLPVTHTISLLVVPGLIDQLTAMKKLFLPCLFSNHPQFRPYHFCPPGFLHPVTVFYELTYGETEMRQVEVRRALHLRLGLPLDRPLLLIANAMNFAHTRNGTANDATRKASLLLKDVHVEVPGSGLSGGLVSLIDGSYEYYHYLQDGFDDSGWGCAYRSLQTIISWFRLQHYTSIKVPSHREIQQALVEIGDKDPSFIGSREWIGAIELSFVLDKLLGVSCKIINVRSGSELPEKRRELAMHFETQGTPVMIACDARKSPISIVAIVSALTRNIMIIGGGVLAYTLLGVDYNDASGDSAFLILDPHYTGADDLKKVVNGGWCGWKKPVDSKGRNFFLHDKFYNLLLPQRPNWV